MRRRERERGQGLVEFALVVPVILLIVVSVAELGLAFGNVHTIGYGSREGARVGSALATGNVSDCSGGEDPAGVDMALVSAVQRILKSPGSGIDVSKVQEIRIFKAT
ncbi:MAG: TadE/TadG family type IV pilus assembly protein, partial [Chloroflexota bacterium]|nr:TadE/TadG family type IV pilus assembly protein [Chloroflexota bacterium]